VRAVNDALEAALAKRTELSFTPLRELLQPPASMDKRLAKAKAEAARGRQLLENLEVPEGLAAIEKAVSLSERSLVRLAETSGLASHATLLTDLAFAHFMAGDKKKCEAALIRAFVLAPKLEFDRKRFPPEMKRLFESTRFLLDELGTGTLVVKVVPEGAAVRVDGTAMGAAPVTAPDLIAGPNLVTASVPGYRTQTVNAIVEPGKTVETTLRLKELKGNVAGLLHSAVGEAQAGVPQRWLAEAAARVKQSVLFIGGANARGDLVELDVIAYDAVKGRVAGRVKTTVAIPEAEREASTVASSLIATMNLEVVAARPTGPKGPSWVVRFYRSKYFWPVVGGVLGAAAIGTGLGVGLYYGTRGSDRDRRFLLYH